jgi:thiamine pyrophosphate-dependent acetolactate synthase large subunit-like protein
MNGFTDALRRDGEITWEHVPHEEAAGFAAAAGAALTGELAVAAHIPREEIGTDLDNPDFTGIARAAGLSGEGSELIELTWTNLRELEVE